MLDEESFAHAVELYGRIHQGVESYGEGTRSEQATNFYLDTLLQPAAERAAAVSDKPRAPVHLLISLCGFTPTPTILSHELLRPRRLVVVVSHDAEDSIDVIAERVTRPAGPLRPRDFHHRLCDPTDPLSIYRLVKEELDRYGSPEEGRPYSIIDITGGRKVMSAAAALAAWQLKLDLSYLEGRFNRHTRHPEPGTDRMLILADPTTLFGEQEMARALEMFRTGAFEAAHRRYDELCDSIAVPGQARFMRALSAMYRSWCDLDLERLAPTAADVRAALGHARRELSPAQVSLLEEQLEFVHRLTRGDRTAMLVCFYVLGLHYERVGRRDFAALLFYRSIEESLILRLEHRYPGLDREQFDWSTMGGPTARQRFADLQQRLGENASRVPRQLTLMISAKLLASAGDEMMDHCGLRTPAALTDLQSLTRKRNKSVLAHGSRSISAADTALLRDQAAELLRAYWRLHGDGGDLDARCERLRFLRVDR